MEISTSKLNEFQNVLSGNPPTTSPDDAIQQLRIRRSNDDPSTTPPDDTTKQFIIMISRFTVWHVALLDLFDNPPEWFIRRRKPLPTIFTITSSLSQVMCEAYPELKQKDAFYNQVWKELNDNRLIDTPGFQTMMTSNGWKFSRTTELGKNFLKFIKEYVI